MYKELSERENAEINQIKVDSIKKALTELQEIVGYTPKNNKVKIEEMNKIADIVEPILYYNQQNQEGKDLKILTPNQMLSRLPIFFSSIKSRK